MRIDPNVVGRLLIEAAPELETNNPRVTRMCCLDLSPESHGNGTGVGIADLTTTRLLAAIEQDRAALGAAQDRAGQVERGGEL